MSRRHHPGMKRRRALRLCLLLPLVLGGLPSFCGAQGTGGEPNLVGTMPLEGIMQKPANFFDLVGKTLRFTPNADGSYSVQTLSTADLVDTPTLLTDPGTGPPRSWSLALPFRFPFAGRTWERVFVSISGNLTFEKPESELQTERPLWPSASMRSVAAAIDSRAAAGLEQMIAVLWSDNHPWPEFSQVRLRLDEGGLAVTWSVRRMASPGSYQPLGENLFQVRLDPSGVVEMAYPRVAERDGIVGLFTGQPARGARLDHADFTGQAPHPSVDIASVDIYDAGTNLQFVYTMKNDALAAVPSGTLAYLFFIDCFGYHDVVGVHVSSAPRGHYASRQPGAMGFEIQGRTVTMYVSKVHLGGRKQFSWSGEVVWWGMPGRVAWMGAPRMVDLTAASGGEADLSATTGPVAGNCFEVFHHPQFTNRTDHLLQAIYRQFPPTDDFAVVFTDVRFDHLFPGEGGSFSPLNFPIRGLGERVANPDILPWSSRLQASMAPAWIGAYAFQETGVMHGVPFRGYAKAVSWIAHELTHRWGIDLRFRNPSTGQAQPLGIQHWLETLHNPAFIPLGSKYFDTANVEHSIQGGSVWTENPDGTFTPRWTPWGLPGGLSGLDLYLMGLLPPEQVPDTFLLQDLRDLGNNRWSATKVPVRIQDILAVEGPRVPSAAEAQKVFRLAFYLLHEPGRDPDPALVQRANALARAVADFFETATGGRMPIVHARLQPVPHAPSALAAAAVSPLQVQLTWSDNSPDETGFRIERTTGNGPFTPVATVGPNVTRYTDSGVSGRTEYRYRVVATSLVGDSLPSNEARVSTP